MDKTSLEQPNRYSQLQQLMTTGLTAGNSIVGQFDQSVFGMREGIVIEATRVGSDALSKAEVLIRAYMRLDTAVLRAPAFTKLTGIARASAATNGKRIAA